MKKLHAFLLLALFPALPAAAEPIKIAITLIELPAKQILPADPAEVLKLKAITTRRLPVATANSGEEIVVKDVKEIKAHTTIEAGTIFHILPTMKKDDSVLFRFRSEIATFEGYMTSGPIGTPGHPPDPKLEVRDPLYSTAFSADFVATTPCGAPLVTFIKDLAKPAPEDMKLGAIDRLLNDHRIYTRLYAIITFTKG